MGASITEVINAAENIEKVMSSLDVDFEEFKADFIEQRKKEKLEKHSKATSSTGLPSVNSGVTDKRKRKIREDDDDDDDDHEEPSSKKKVRVPPAEAFGTYDSRTPRAENKKGARKNPVVVDEEQEEEGEEEGGEEEEEEEGLYVVKEEPNDRGINEENQEEEKEKYKGIDSKFKNAGVNNKRK